MTSLAERTPPEPVLFRELGRPRELFANIGPNWYASIMGTGIVANAAATLPHWNAALRVPATVVWVFATVMLLALLFATVVHWVRHTDRARGHAANPVAAQFWGAPPMALMTVGAGALSIGSGILGTSAGLTIDYVLWTAGTVFGLFTAAWIPYKMMTSHRIAPDAAFGGWLMPVVPPMVSAANGAALIPHIADPGLRTTMTLGCYAMFGISLFATLCLIPQIWQKLVHHKTTAATAVPTMWIVLGPLGQSVTAANLLGKAAPAALPAPYGKAAEVFGWFYGIPVWGFAMLWLVIAAAVTIRTLRSGMPFALTWWAFTFPVGTCVTGSSALAARTGAGLFADASLVLYVFLVFAWAVVAVRTMRGSLRGELLRPA
ncbi:TDT family transporter [Sciscionella marina]|uniref:TDT family transporter n=1 Tax=Sciscionella marina TaxID=508770 RepID=UPI00036EB4DA|nr:TDT family transporter [Sciscionella marina]